MSGHTFEEVSAALLASNWIFAKTMPQWPHWYTLRKDWTQPVDFEAVVQYIRDHGYQEKFYTRTMTRLNVGKHKYWSMGAPLNETILINRADINSFPDRETT